MAGTPRVSRMRETREEPDGVVLITREPLVMRTTRARPPRAQLLAIEPRPGDLLAEARDAGRSPGRFCANETFLGYGRSRGHGIKPRLARLVGWFTESADPAIRTSDVYRLAYQTVYGALPDCRGCGCFVVL